MRQSTKGEGTKIAQAAKDLNVTSVTIRRYISEFNIETTSDENGIKVLPARSMAELHEIRRLKEDGLTNPKVLEDLEEMRAKAPAEKAGKAKAEPKKTARRLTEPVAKVVEPPAKVVEPPAKKEVAKRVERKVMRKEESAPAAPVVDDADDEDVRAQEPMISQESSEDKEDGDVDLGGDGKSKHTLTCQTCSKTFEHMNPRLRDCLECYRAKRKERRRGGDKHKNVIQHPLAQQVADKQQRREAGDENGGEYVAERTIDATPPAREGGRALREPREPREQRSDRGDRDRGDRDRGDRDRGDRDRGDRDRSDRDRDRPAADVGQVATPLPLSSKRVNPLSGMQRQAPVRNYRKAIEETRSITANLKRRLERPDLPENERRWLEQIYAYQLILHQGWRHLAEYKAGNTPQKPQE